MTLPTIAVCRIAPSGSATIPGQPTMFKEGIDLETLLAINHLRTYFYQSNAVIPAVDDVSFTINKGETLCMVGESGCGKSVTAFSIIRLLPMPPARFVSGEILFQGEDLLKKTNKQMCAIRGNQISFIYQEPMTSLNPVFTIGMQLSETLRIHKNMNAKEARDYSIHMLELVGIPSAAMRMDEYPHQLSGGMRQRVMIALGLCCDPELLIADEPTTALDVTIQAQILDLMQNLKQKLGMTILFITHDLGVVAEIAQRVIVMYAGKIVEEGATATIFAQPRHPYTKGLMKCIPRVEGAKKEVLPTIKGVVPPPDQFPAGCRFHPRCPLAADVCRSVVPEMRPVGQSHVACHLA